MVPARIVLRTSKRGAGTPLLAGEPKCASYVVLFSVCALMWTAPLLTQATNGLINGLIVDSSNRVIVAADVVVVNDVTGVHHTTKTNEEGIYVLPNLPPGPYRLQVSKIGFKTTLKPEIVLNVQDALSITSRCRGRHTLPLTGWRM